MSLETEATPNETQDLSNTEPEPSEEKRTRRGPLTFAEKLDQMHGQKQTHLERIRAREFAQVIELERTRAIKTGLERELAGIDKARSEARTD